MQTIDQLSARLFLIFAFGLPLDTVLCGSNACLAQSDQKEVSTSGKKLFVRKIEFNLGDEGANKVALSAMKTKCGDEFDRDSIAADLESIFAALSKYWESAKADKPPFYWANNLRAEPTKNGVNGVIVTISISTPIKISSSYVTGSFDTRALPPVFRDPLHTVGWNSFDSYRTGGSVAPRTQSHFKHSGSAHSSCHLSGTSAGQHRELQNFLNGSSDCFAGYDAY